MKQLVTSLIILTMLIGFIGMILAMQDSLWFMLPLVFYLIGCFFISGILIVLHSDSSPYRQKNRPPFRKL